MAVEDQLRDNNYSSRKFWVCVGGGLLVVAVGLCAAVWNGIQAVYIEMIGGLLGFAGLYVTGNIAQNFAVSKTVANSMANNIGNQPTFPLAQYEPQQGWQPMPQPQQPAPHPHIPENEAE